MAKKKVDAVIEAVHYASDGKVAWVRAYERRGPTYSDRVMLDRSQLVERLKAGKKIFTGKRVEFLSSTFDLDQPVSLAHANGSEIVVAGGVSSNQDVLAGAPVI